MSTPTPAPVAPPAAAGTGAPAPATDDSLRSLLAIARPLALLFAGLAGLLFLIFLALLLINAVLGRGAGDIVAVAYCAASAAINFLIWRQIPGLQRSAAAGQYAALREPLLVWAILGIVFFLIVGIVLLLAWVKVDEKSRAPRPA